MTEYFPRMEWIELLLSAIGGASVALLVVGFLGQKLVDLWVSRSLEKYKAELQQKSEVLKTELAIYAHEQNVGLTRIDAQRSEAILSLWTMLGEWHEVFLYLTAPNRKLEKDPPKAIQKYQDWARQLMALSDKLSVEVRNRAIFFDQSAYEAIARCGMAISDLTNDFYAESYEGVDLATVGDAAAFLGGVSGAREKLRDSAMGNVNELRRALVHAFRVLMKAEKMSTNPTAEANRPNAARGS